MTNFLKQFNEEYTFLYEHDNVAGYLEAVRWFDENQGRPGIKSVVEALRDERQDVVSSDREAAAFAFACEALDIR